MVKLGRLFIFSKKSKIRKILHYFCNSLYILSIFVRKNRICTRVLIVCISLQYIFIFFIFVFLNSLFAKQIKGLSCVFFYVKYFA